MNKFVRLALPVCGLLASAGCAPRVHMRLVPPTPFSKAMLEETVTKGFTQAEINRCFGESVKAEGGIRTHLVHDTRKTDGRVCYISFIRPTKADPDRLELNLTAYDRMDADTCTLKALSCLRPDAARRIATRFNRSIEHSPIPRH